MSDMFNPLEYWKERHDKFQNDSRSVGCMSFDTTKNDEIYAGFTGYLGEYLMAKQSEKSSNSLNVLDLACGTFLYAKSLVGLENVKFTGVDISDTAILQAKQNYPEGEYISSDVSSPTLLAGRKFDIIIVRTVLIHVVNDERWLMAMENIKRLLSQDGVVLLIDKLPKEKRESPASHVIFRSFAEYQNVCEKLGMVLKEINTEKHYYEICHS